MKPAEGHGGALVWYAGESLYLQLSARSQRSHLGARRAAYAQNSPASAISCGSNAVGVKFKNELGYPIWLGEQGPSVIAPIVNGDIDWEIESGNSVNLCLPKGYASANFWARTECQFDTYYPTSCSKTNKCGAGEDCFGGRCVAGLQQ